MDHRELPHLSQQQHYPARSSTSISTSSPSLDALASYQHQKPDVVGPGITKILQELERQERRRRDPHHEGEERMKRRTRILYVLLGVILLCVYLSLLKRHFFGIPQDGSKQREDDIRREGRTTTTTIALRAGESGSVELQGSTRHHNDDDEKECNDGDYSKRTLKLAYELPFAAIFKDTKGQSKYEASAVILVDGTAYAIFDNSWAISKFGDDLKPFSSENKQIGQPNREGEDSGYEALFHDNGTFYVMRESVLHQQEKKGPSSHHAIIEELSMIRDGDDEDYEVVNACPCEFEFEGDSKGFEGVLSFRDSTNELVVLGLCEGNHCWESEKFDRGHGLFVAMQKIVRKRDDGSSYCQWNTIRTIEIPSTANFNDYSSATWDEHSGRVAIASQEESAIWVGQMMGYDDTMGAWDLNKLEFDPTVGDVYTFPKNDNCETIYCNIESIHWINNEMIIAVSDKMKSNGKQDFRSCFDKDESVHVFVLPS